MKNFRIVLATVFVAVVVTLAAAQTTGGLRVQVLDAADRSPLPGATVVLSNDKQLVAETAAITDPNGMVEFPILRAGSGYMIRVEKEGFAEIRDEGIRVGIGKTEIRVVQLVPEGELAEKVEVIAERPVVDLEDTRTTTSFGDEFIQDLPVQGRFYTNILTLAPGVDDEDNDGNPNVHGGRERDFATVVGGVSNVDPLTGLKLGNINIDSIEEIEVITAGVGVEYGRATAGLANIIEKQGTNNFEGVFSFTFRSSLLDGNGATNIESSRVPDFEWFQPALTLSGPVIKDKLWYFLANELIDREDPVNTLARVEVETTKQITSTNKLTWQASRRNKLELANLYNSQEIGNLGVDSTTPAESTRTWDFTVPTWRLSWTAPYSPKLLVEGRAAFTDASLNITPSSTAQGNECVTGNPVFDGAQCINLVTGFTSGPWPITWEDSRQRLTVAADADVYVGQFLGANHQLRVGFSVENERYSRQQSRRPFLLFFPLRGFADDDPTGGGQDPGDIQPLAFISANLDVPQESSVRATNANWALYVKDQIRPLSNLNITVGARVSRQTIESEGFRPFDPTAQSLAFLNATAAETAPCSFRGDPSDCKFFTRYEDYESFIIELGRAIGFTNTSEIQKNFTPEAALVAKWGNIRSLENFQMSETVVSPELSFSWDPFKSGKTQIAATFGRSYGNTFLNIPVLEQDAINTDLNFIAERDAAGRFFVDDICGDDACINPTANSFLVDRNLELPYQDEYTLSFERQLAAETGLKVTYVRRKNENQFQDIDINHDVADLGYCVCAAGNCRVEPTVDAAGIPFPVGTPLGPDPFTGEQRFDQDPGPGDGVLDDCIGRLTFELEEPDPDADPFNEVLSGQVRQVPDGFRDSYILNPAWGEVFLIGNFNTSDYEGVIVELTRRQYRNWQMNASYTWSQVIGDAEDFAQQLGDDRALAEDERGYLDFDHRHSVKINATTIVPWWGGFRFGGSVRWQSGYPYSIEVFRTVRDAVYDAYPFQAPSARGRRQYPSRQRNDQRNESWWTIDVRAVKELNLRGGMNLQMTAEIFNLLNEDHLRVFTNFNGFNAQVREFGRRFQMGMRLAF